MQISYQIWVHKPSGEKYVVKCDDAGNVVEGIGPIGHGDSTVGLDGYEFETEDVDWFNGEDFNVLYIEPDTA